MDLRVLQPHQEVARYDRTLNQVSHAGNPGSTQMRQSFQLIDLKIYFQVNS